MFYKYFLSILPIIVVVYYKTMLNSFVDYCNFLSLEKTNHRVYTIEELEEYTTTENGLYLSILGEIFDVTAGLKHYGPGASYHHFTGRDASAAFVTGDFESKGLVDDVSTFTLYQMKSLDDWRQFYRDRYVYKGKLKGRYYKEDGLPTDEWHRVQEKLKLAHKRKSQEEILKRKFPPCNVEWKPDSGTEVWCTKESGGIKRDWIGVPRMFFYSSTSQQYKCVCVDLNSKEYEEAKGSFKEYKGCSSRARCYIKRE
ncbi:neuferricin isoform X2 [Prorops nasuta]|uniref:neuferricin isoform X2 n=1 Tax=Prorops nasuta TaxID=863751 RepID=UPI0034CF4706